MRNFNLYILIYVNDGKRRPGRCRYRRSGRDADTSVTPQDAWTPSSCPNKDNNTILQFGNPWRIYQNTEGG